MKVADVLRMLQKDGWILATTRGSQASDEGGTRNGSGQAERRRCAGDVEQCLEPGRVEEVRSNMRYAVVIEKANGNYSAYVPDLPGCIATGATIEEASAQIREAIEFHVDGMREDGNPTPLPSSHVEYVDVAA